MYLWIKNTGEALILISALREEMRVSISNNYKDCIEKLQRRIQNSCGPSGKRAHDETTLALMRSYEQEELRWNWFLDYWTSTKDGWCFGPVELVKSCYAAAERQGRLLDYHTVY